MALIVIAENNDMLLPLLVGQYSGINFPHPLKLKNMIPQE